MQNLTGYGLLSSTLGFRKAIFLLQINFIVIIIWIFGIFEKSRSSYSYPIALLLFSWVILFVFVMFCFTD